MNPTPRILAVLRERDLLQLAQRVAADHHVSVDEICSGERRRDVVEARHDLWLRLHDELELSLASIGRIFGTDHGSVLYAVRKDVTAAFGEPRPIVGVVLAVFDGREESYLLRWSRRPEPFGISQKTTAETTWYRDYAVARARFDVLCERAGAPSFRSHANGHLPPVEARENGGAS